MLVDQTTGQVELDLVPGNLQIIEMTAGDIKAVLSLDATMTVRFRR